MFLVAYLALGCVPKNAARAFGGGFGVLPALRSGRIGGGLIPRFGAAVALTGFHAFDGTDLPIPFPTSFKRWQ